MFKSLSGEEAFSDPHFCTKHFYSLLSPDHSEKGNIGSIVIFSYVSLKRHSLESEGWME